jgi:hypothetical protein
MEKQKNFVILLIPILILTVVWVLSNVFHGYVDSTIELPLQEEIIPIEGSFDMQTISKIKERIRVNPLNDIIPKDAEEPVNEKIATRSAKLETQTNTGTASADVEL